MSQKKINKLICFAAAVSTALTAVCCSQRIYAGTPYVGDPDRYYLVNRDTAVDDGSNGYTILERQVTFHFDFETNGEERTYTEEWRVLPKCARSIKWGTPQAVLCNYCRARVKDSVLFQTRIFIEDDRGKEYVSKSGTELNESDLASSGIDFDNLSSPLRVGLTITQYPGIKCPYCNRHIGDRVTVDGLYWTVPCIAFASQPSSVVSVPGGGTAFEVSLSRYLDGYLEPAGSYKWVQSYGDEWIELSDGTGPFGETYKGCNTNRLVINNISQSMKGSMYRCMLAGANGKPAYSDTAVLNMADITPAPTAPPDITPTMPPNVTPVPTIIPGGGSSSAYIPATSSSAYKPPGGSSSQPKSSSSVTSSSSSGGGSTFKGDIIPGSSSNHTPIIGGDDSSSSSKKRSSSSGKNTPGRPASSSGSTGYSNRSDQKPGSSYITKNGVLYIVDDYNDSVAVDNGGSEDDIRVESTERENMYSEADLAIDGELYEMDATKGFFDTAWGRAVIIGGAVLILLLLLFFLMFGVVVFGEVEEHDDVFDLCGIRLLRWRNKNWSVKLGKGFDDNAVLTLRVGLVFALIFEDWELVGESSGMYEGNVRGQIKQGMMLYRKNVRR